MKALLPAQRAAPSAPDATPGTLRGAWDFPQADGSDSVGSAVTRDGRLPCVGWALDGDDPPAVHITIDGRTVETRPTMPREDIGIIFSYHPAASGPTGWADAIDVSGLAPGPHAVSVTLRSRGAALDLGTRTVVLPEPPAPAPFPAPFLDILRCPRTGHALRSSGGRLVQDGSDVSYALCGSQVFFSGTPGDWRHHATSTWGFSPYARRILAATGGPVLALGAGICRTHPRLIQCDVFDYPNIDVISDHPVLPFDDAVFDGVICENVIEHVPDPFQLMREVRRILKPAGYLGFNGTNMHFTHGFPSHYFNPTEHGMRLLAEDVAGCRGEIASLGLRDSLATIVRYYLDALVPDARAVVETMTMKEFFDALQRPEGDLRERDRALTALPERAQAALASNVYFFGRKQT